MMLSLPSTSTACRIWRIVDMPVERMIVRPVTRIRRSRSSSVKHADATLCAGTSNPSKKFVDAELHTVAVVDITHAAPGRVTLDSPLITGSADLWRPLLKLGRVAAGIGGLVDQGDRGGEVPIVVDSDLTGDVNGSTGTDHSIAEMPVRSVQNP